MKRAENKPKRSEKTMDYIHNYDKNAYKKVILRIRYDDVIVLDKLNQVGSKNSYILDLIRKDVTDNFKI